MAPIPTVPTAKKPATRMTRAQAAAKAPATDGATGGGKGSSIFSRSKEGLRKASEKFKEKDQGAHHQEVKSMPSVSGSSQSIASMEALKAYLRIRPCPADGTSQRPYLSVQNDREVLMRPDTDSYSTKPAHVYSFDHVFPPESSTQASFFTQTTFPLVEKLLQGENGLVFAYGVTNSGKTYTISGEDNEGEQGLLPRAVDVVFNSIQGMQSKANIKCVGPSDIAFERGRSTPLLGAADVQPSTKESVKLDKNYSYAVFVSCAEVYNDKIHDLLDTTIATANLPASASARRQQSMLMNSRTSSAFARSSIAALASTSNNRLTRRQLTLKRDPDGNGKYVQGLHEVRARTQGEALALLRAGQANRQVFATQSNNQSSRSHGIFTIKVVRIHNGAPEDPDSAYVSRLSIVDLAGSERNKNTGTSGAQLKEAGQINQSLMILGQCLQTLRDNQAKVSAAPPGKTARQIKVPFQHSKLTDLFQSFFVGDGRAAMIVNINPYDTGYDENSHVMKFSAVAREVQTTAGNKVGHGSLRKQISTHFSHLRSAFQGPGKLKLSVPETPNVQRQASGISGLPSRAYDQPGQRSNGTPSVPPIPTKARTASDEWSLVEREVEIEVVEEEDEGGSDDEDESDAEQDVLVASLFEQLREARQELFEAELRNRTIAEQVRAQLIQEMAEAHEAQEAEHRRQITAIYAAAEDKANSKLDIMARMHQPQLCDACGGHAGQEGEDVSMEEDTPDQSFVSALDTSRRVSSGNPFVVRTGSGLVGKKVHAGDASSASSHVTSPLSSSKPFSNIPRVKREATAESEDILSRPLSPHVADEDEIGNDTRSTNEVDEEEEGSDAEGSLDLEEEEDVPSGEQADQDSSSEAESESEPDSSGSDFDAGAAAASSSDAESQPVRRASMARRKTGSPVKRSSPVKGTPRNTKQKISPRRSAKGSAAKLIKGKVAGVGRTPLSVRSEQEGDAEAEEEESLVKEAKPKKKRALGRKIALEEDMPDPSTPISGAEVRRLNKMGRM